MAAAAPMISKTLTTDVSTPANLDRWCSGTRTWVNCWVVKSNTQTPKREKERNEKITRLQPRFGAAEGIEEDIVSCFSREDEIAHRAATTGACTNVLAATSLALAFYPGAFAYQIQYLPADPP